MIRVGEYLSAPRPTWDWVTLDCCRWVDRWVQLRGHGSPILALGLKYDSETSALRRIAEAGGLVPLWSAGMAMLFVPETDEPRAGDVGIIRRETTCRTNEAAAIYTGERWASLALRGLDIAPAETLRVWRV